MPSIILLVRYEQANCWRDPPFPSLRPGGYESGRSHPIRVSRILVTVIDSFQNQSEQFHGPSTGKTRRGDIYCPTDVLNGESLSPLVDIYHLRERAHLKMEAIPTCSGGEGERGRDGQTTIDNDSPPGAICFEPLY